MQRCQGLLKGGSAPSHSSLHRHRSSSLCSFLVFPVLCPTLQPVSSSSQSQASDSRSQLFDRFPRTMARSQQQWRRGSQLLLLAAAVALVLLIAAGSADAICYTPYTNCGGNCVDLKVNPSHCGACYNKCKLDESKWKYGETYCSGGTCYSRCKSGWKHDSKKGICYQ